MKIVNLTDKVAHHNVQYLFVSTRNLVSPRKLQTTGAQRFTESASSFQ